MRLEAFVVFLFTELTFCFNVLAIRRQKYHDEPCYTRSGPCAIPGP